MAINRLDKNHSVACKDVQRAQVARMITGGDGRYLLQTIYFTKCLDATCFVLERDPSRVRRVRDREEW